ncbi:MAG: adenylate/guanylate cyclase domain-containing protein, partial [Pseudomonadota bacterium]
GARPCAVRPARPIFRRGREETMDDLKRRRAGVEQRLDRMLAAEGVERMRTGAIATTAAFLVIAPVLIFLAGLPDAFYYWALLTVFILSVWLQFAAVRRWPDAEWPDYVFPAVNFALLSFTLAVPNPMSDFAESVYAPSLLLRTGNSIYFFLILSVLALSLSERAVLWGGFCAVTSWSAARWWVISQPGIELFDPPQEALGSMPLDEAIVESLHPRYVDPGVWLQEVLVFAIVAGILAVVVRGSRRLLLRRALEERRGANLARYLPMQLAERMAESDEPFLEEREAEAAVIFTDVVGFTRWSEAHPPGEVVALLREVHGLVAEEVFRAEGVLDKFIGDGAMATFGVAKTGDAPQRAMDCVEAIVRRADAMSAKRAAQGLEPLRLSVGAHYGRVTIGDVGAEERLEMAVLGDTVNVAARLEAATRALDAGALVSDALMRAAGGPRPGWEAQGAQVLKGRAEGVAAWSMPRGGPGGAAAGAAVRETVS